MNRKTSTALLSVASNSGLIVLKVVVGVASGSVSILSEAIHSSIDLVAALIALFSVMTSDQPPDAGHPYGHGKVENVSGVVEAILILAASALIVEQAARRLFHPEPIAGLGLAFAVMFFSALVNFLVSRRLAKIAKLTSSIALEADALHLKADVFTSLGVGAGLFCIWLPDALFGLKLYFLDPLVAIAVALFITFEAAQMLRRAFSPLVDASLPPDELAIIAEAVVQHRQGGPAFHDLRTRSAGKQKHIDFHLTLPSSMTVGESHEICDRIEREIEARLPNTVVLIHVEPEGHA
jgi:cation diffusion facilitator family transporter